MKASIRKIILQVDEIHFDGGKAVNPPTRRALAMAVIANPYAGCFSESLDELIDIGEELGAMLGERCVQALGIAPEQAQSFAGQALAAGLAGQKVYLTPATKRAGPMSLLLVRDETRFLLTFT
jgi:hypothetical protein